jgi:hypothetical protein
LSKFEDHSNYNCCITLDNGEDFVVFANWIHNNNLDQWHGWTCDAGHTRLMIDKDLNVWSGECKNDFFGRADEHFYTNASTVCKRKTCTPCTDDLSVRKSQL